MNPIKEENKDNQSQDKAVELIRGKVDAIYKDEPDAQEEIQEVETIRPSKMSKHQKYMNKLHESGKSMAAIQTAWHQYYISLNDVEKHEVWQEFYSEHKRAREEEKVKTTLQTPNNRTINRKKIPASEVKHKLMGNMKPHKRLRDNHHVKAMAFGIGMGSLVVFVLMFSFFNERFITPFIRPSTNVSATPIIVDPNNNGPVGPEAKIIIPKINLEAPVVYDVPTIEEVDVQKGLESGVVHYATTPNPGEKGNAVIFGHSSSNILNKGKYKFAFILLKSLEKDDTFIIQKDGKRYVYKVYNKFITDPKDLSVLGPNDKPATVTLITCDPPGTSTNRLIIQAEQIFPDPSTNTDSTAKTTDIPEKLPSNSKSLWSRIFGS